jgi:hypothetical protein
MSDTYREFQEDSMTKWDETYWLKAIQRIKDMRVELISFLSNQDLDELTRNWCLIAVGSLTEHLHRVEADYKYIDFPKFKVDETSKRVSIEAGEVHKKSIEGLLEIAQNEDVRNLLTHVLDKHFIVPEDYWCYRIIQTLFRASVYW